MDTPLLDILPSPPFLNLMDLPGRGEPLKYFSLSISVLFIVIFDHSTPHYESPSVINVKLIIPSPVAENTTSYHHKAL